MCLRAECLPSPRRTSLIPSTGKWRVDCGSTSCDPNPQEAEARGLPGVQGLLVILLAWVRSKTSYQCRGESSHVRPYIKSEEEDHDGLIDKTCVKDEENKGVASRSVASGNGKLGRIGGSVNRVRFHAGLHAAFYECPASESWPHELFCEVPQLIQILSLLSLVSS